MRCSKCGSDNREGRKFCTTCGTALLASCPKCGAPIQPGESFCGECGTALGGAAPAAAADTAPVTAFAGGERRHLTVLFCDLVGSTAIAAQLDPEQWRETVDGYHRAAAEAITRFDGHVAKYLGDGVMAYFGWPAAHDNDAERAARAGLAILDAIAKLNEQASSEVRTSQTRFPSAGSGLRLTGSAGAPPSVRPELSARVGIDSGLVVIGKGAGGEAEVFGDTANLAARVQAAAKPGSVAISDATHRLVSGLFIVEDCGAQELKGIERPLQLYRVVRPSGIRGRLEAATAAGGLTPFVGREDELRSLLSRWERVLDGEGQVVTIIGEAGIGKSRLVQCFREKIAATPYTWLECATAPFFQNTPFYAVADMLQQSFYWEASHTVEQRLAALEASLGLAGLDPDEAVPLIAPLLELPVGTRYPPLSMAPDQQRKRLLATVVAWTLGAAQAQPLVIATEDLHWADPSTLELTQLLVEQGTHARMLLIYTARPEFHAPWPMRAHHTQINLNRLTAGNVRTMVAEVAAKIALSDETVATVVERTGGVPLFVEELTRAVLEGGDLKLTGREIPATLHDSLMSRLDRLGPAKEVLQISAVIGSQFSYELLQAVLKIGDEELQQALHALADAELLYVRGIAPDVIYQFKHALIRDAAYEALLKSRRKELHHIVARTIEEQFSVIKEAHPEVLARHWTEAGETEPAIAGWQKAGEQAVERGAYREAERHYREALANLELVPESRDRDGRELKLQLALGGVMAATRGWSGIDTAAVYTRARTLAEQAGAAESLTVFRGLWASALTRGELRAALVLADQMLEIASGIDTPQALDAAHYAQGFSRLCLGDLPIARQHFRLAIERCLEEDFRGEPEDFWGYDALAWAAVNEWLLGYPDRALRYTADAQVVARRLGNPFAIAYVDAVGVWTDGWRGDFDRVAAAAEEAERLGTELALPMFFCSKQIIWQLGARSPGRTQRCGGLDASRSR